MLDGHKAWRRMLDSRSARWKADRFAGSVPEIALSPKFRIEPGEPVFCIGSCFARNIEEHLSYSGVPVLSRRLISPVEEWPSRPTGMVNKFTTPSMLNEIRWLEQLPDDLEPLFSEGPDGWLDLQIKTRPVSLERAIARRRYLTTEYFARLGSARIVVLTLGLSEVWFDRLAGLHLNATPPERHVERNPGRFTVGLLGLKDNLKALEELRERIRRLNPAIRFVVTVSPVPLEASFTGPDVLLVNALSKSILRVAATAFADAHDDVDYFPSFEMISLGQDVWAPDRRHVADEAVSVVVGRFIGAYLGQEPADIPFKELAYLRANPDVEARVRTGELESGHQHWITVGRQENRPLVPSEPPPPKMVAQGLGW